MPTRHVRGGRALLFVCAMLTALPLAACSKDAADATRGDGTSNAETFRDAPYAADDSTNTFWSKSSTLDIMPS